MPARAPPWAGYYADPLHGHCLRAVRPTRDPRVFEIVGDGRAVDGGARAAFPGRKPS